MELDEFFKTQDLSIDKIMPLLPEWFTIDPHLMRFVLSPPLEKKKHLNFAIGYYQGCLPVFSSKVAGVTFEGRPQIIARMASAIDKATDPIIITDLSEDLGNKHHKNAIQVMIQIQSKSGAILIKRTQVGYLPKHLANFIRFAKSYGVGYKCLNETTIKRGRHTKALYNPSISIAIKPFYTPLKEAIADDEPTRTPMTKKIITGVTIEDFRKALLKKPNRK
jgi:hypothetical protein